MSKSNLLAEAMADIKALRAVAYANAKSVLEEAFTPKVTEMLTKKLKEEAEMEEDDKDKNLDESSDQDDADYKKKSKGHSTKKEFSDSVKTVSVNETSDQDDADYKKKSKGHSTKKEFSDGVKTVVVENEEEIASDDTETLDDKSEVSTDENEEGLHKDVNAEIDEILREFEGSTEEESSEEAPDALAQAPSAEKTDVSAPSDEEVEIDVTPEEGESEHVAEVPAEGDGDNDEEKHSEVNIDEILAELENEKEYAHHRGIDGSEENLEELNSLKTENKKLKTALLEMKKQVNEVNLLNSRLLYVGKLFKENSLNIKQKEQIVEAFDSANTLKEITLTFKLLSETFKGHVPKSPTIKSSKQTIVEGLASKVITSTKPNLITESKANAEDVSLSQRLQKLAGIKIK